MRRLTSPSRLLCVLLGLLPFFAIAVAAQAPAPARYWDRRSGPGADLDIAVMAGSGQEYICAVYGSANVASTKLLWRSTDGLGWELVTSPSVNSVESLEYGGGEYWAFARRANAWLILRSSNGGLSWTETPVQDSVDLPRFVQFPANFGLSHVNGRWWLSLQYSSKAETFPGRKLYYYSSANSGWEQVLDLPNTSYATGSDGFLKVAGNGSNTIVVIGSDGLLGGKRDFQVSSDNGVTWHEKEGLVASSVAYGNGRFVATGNQATLVSADNGASWTKHEGVLAGATIDFVNGLFVAGAGSISQDGVTWLPPASEQNNWGISGSATKFFPSGPMNFLALAYGDYYQSRIPSGAAQIFLFELNIAGTVGQTLQPQTISTFPEATSFKAYGLPKGVSISSAGVISGTPEQGGNITATIYPVNANGTGRFLQVHFAVARPGQPVAPALYWGEREGPWAGAGVVAVAGTGAEYVCATYSDGANASTGLLWRSINGLDWQSLSSPPVNAVESLAYGNGVYLALAHRPAGWLLLRSKDRGLSWPEELPVRADLGEEHPANANARLDYANGRWWLSVQYYVNNQATYSPPTQGLKLFVSSDDGESWKESLYVPKTGLGSSDALQVAGDGEQALVVVGSGGYFSDGYFAVSSDNGLNWDKREPVDVYAVAFGNDRFVVAGRGSTMVSTDRGKNWTTIENGLTGTAVGFHNGLFVTSTTSTGECFTSFDGALWTPMAFDDDGLRGNITALKFLPFGSVDFLAFSLEGWNPTYHQSRRTPAPPRILSELEASGAVGDYFIYQIVAINSPNSYGAIGLPPGLRVDTTTGQITGTPEASGRFEVAIQATNAGGTSSALLVLTVAPDPYSDSDTDTDTEFVAPEGITSVKMLPAKRSVRAGKQARLIVMLGNSTTQSKSIEVRFTSSNPEVPAPASITVTAQGKKSEKAKRPRMTRQRIQVRVPEAASGSTVITASVGSNLSSSTSMLRIRPRK
jgi:hypothetical protein